MRRAVLCRRILAAALPCPALPCSINVIVRKVCPGQVALFAQRFVGCCECWHGNQIVSGAMAGTAGCFAAVAELFGELEINGATPLIVHCGTVQQRLQRRRRNLHGRSD